MDISRFKQISRELLELLEQQVQAISNRDSEPLMGEEHAAYESRKQRILELRLELEKLTQEA